MTSFTAERGNTLELAIMGDNRIGNICMDKSSLFKAAHLEARASISVGEYTNYSFAFRQALKLMYARRKPMEQRIAELASDNPRALISYHLWS